MKDKFYKLKSISEQIEKQGLGKGIGIELFPFQKTIYNELDDMLEQISKFTKESGKNIFMLTIQNQIILYMNMGWQYRNKKNLKDYLIITLEKNLSYITKKK